MAARKEFTTLTKLKAMVRYVRCPGVFELGIKCGKPFGSLDEVEFDHIKRCEIEPDNSPENARVLCKSCHQAKTTKKDALEAKKGRHTRGETKKAQRKKQRNTIHAEIARERRKDDTLNRKLQKETPKAKIKSRGFPSKEDRKAAKEWKERQG